jgi:hypothetical protein
MARVELVGEAGWLAPAAVGGSAAAAAVAGAAAANMLSCPCGHVQPLRALWGPYHQHTTWIGAAHPRLFAAALMSPGAQLRVLQPLHTH